MASRETKNRILREFHKRNPNYRRNSQLRYSYGITAEQYDAMLSNQNGVCAICGQPEIGKRLAVDHDHTTNKVRGLLCSSCNTGLGKFKDNPCWLRAGANYLEVNGKLRT